MFDSDLIVNICYILLVLSGLGMAWGLYLWYLDWLWGWEDHSYLSTPIHKPLPKPVKRLTGDLLDKDGRVIARID